MISEATLNKLATFDTPTICNVIELFEIQPRHLGYIRDASIRCNFPTLPPIVGYAATAMARSTYPPTGQDSASYGWLEEQIERLETLSGPAIVVTEDLDKPQVAAMFGDIVCTTYKTFGAKGLITNGAGRDIDQIEKLGEFQLFTNGAICSHGYFHLTELYKPIEIGGLVIYPDDLLHADRNGIVKIPKEIASEVADLGDAFLESERLFLDAVNTPGVTHQEFKAARAASKARQRELRDQVVGGKGS